MFKGKRPTTKCSICGKIIVFEWGVKIPRCRACYIKLYRGESHHRFKGKVLQRGYVRIPMLSHPHAGKDGYVYEHRLVMEKHLGRVLERHEIVHHRDGDPSNNEISNLVVCQSNSEHRRFHRKPNCKECGGPHFARGYCKAHYGQRYSYEQRRLKREQAFGRPMRRYKARRVHSAE